MSKYFVLAGHEVKPASLEEWARSFEDDSRRHVDITEIGNVRVSTVFLGLDHSFGVGPPLLFETMIFGGPHHDYQTRCSTWDEAEAQHAEAVNLVRRSLQ